MVWRKEIHIAGRDAEERPLQLEAITLKRGDSLAALRIAGMEKVTNDSFVIVMTFDL